MKTLLKNYWPHLTIAALLIALGLTVYFRFGLFAVEAKPDRTVETVNELQAQLSGISGQLDTATVLLKKNDKALKETLAKLKGVEWQLALATKLQVERYDSLSAAFGREAARPNYDRELLELLGQ